MKAVQSGSPKDRSETLLLWASMCLDRSKDLVKRAEAHLAQTRRALAET